MEGLLPGVWLRCFERERERERFNLSIQPALAYEDMSMSSAKVRMAAEQ